MRNIALFLIAASGLATAASASSDAAWAALSKQATLRCIQVSHFKRARTSRPVVFSDSNAQVAVLVTGVFPQPALRGVTGANLCLYDRRTKVAEVQEVRGWGFQR